MFSLMGNCISCAKKRREPKKELTLVIFGVDDVGKTTLTKGLLGEELETAPTIGFSNEAFTFENYDVKLFDVGGGKKIRDIWKNYYYDAHGIIYVVDSSKPERMEETRDNMKKVLQHSQVSGKPILVLANKQDLPTAMDEVDLCEQLNLENTVNINKCPCRIEKCSAVKGTGKKIDEGIKDGLRWLCNFISHNWDEINARVEKDQEEEKKKQQIEAEERRERVRKIREERERKQKEEEEEKRRMGIEVPEESEEEEMTGDPFKRLDISTLQKKDLKEKEEKRKKKEFERIRQTKKLDDQDSDDLGGLRVRRSNRTLNRYDLFNGHLKTDKKGDDSQKSEDEDEEDFIISPHARRLTPRLPPLQRPIGTKFSVNEEGPNTKVKKKKKKDTLRTLTESEDENLDSNDPLSQTLRSVSKIDFDTRHDPWSRNDKSYRSSLDKNVHLDVYQQFENERLSPRAQRKLNNLDANVDENDMDVTPRTRKKKGKKKKFLKTTTDDRYQLDASDFTSPRTLGKDMTEDSDDNLNTKSNDIFSISSNRLRTRLPTLDGGDDDDTTLKKTKKKKTYMKKNKTAPSDDEYEMRNNYQDSNIKRDYSWTQSPQKENNHMYYVGDKWRFAEDLPEVDSDSDIRTIRRRPNIESDDDIIT